MLAVDTAHDASADEKHRCRLAVIGSTAGILGRAPAEFGKRHRQRPRIVSVGGKVDIKALSASESSRSKRFWTGFCPACVSRTVLYVHDARSEPAAHDLRRQRQTSAETGRRIGSRGCVSRHQLRKFFGAALRDLRSTPRSRDTAT
jgi:hypothetical protein